MVCKDESRVALKLCCFALLPGRDRVRRFMSFNARTIDTIIVKIRAYLRYGVGRP
jgi:hypothetical protein